MNIHIEQPEYDTCPECEYPKLALQACTNPVCYPGWEQFRIKHNAWATALKAAENGAVARLGWNARSQTRDQFIAANPEPAR